MNRLQYYSHILLYSKIKVFLPLLICISYSFLHNDLFHVSLCEEVKNNNETNQTLIGMSLFVGSIILVFLLQQIGPSFDPSSFSETIISTMDASVNVTPEMLGINPEIPFKSSSSNGFFIKSPEEFEKMLGIVAKNRQTSWIRLDVYEQLLESELAAADAEKLNLQKSLYWAIKYHEYLQGFCRGKSYIPNYIKWLEVKEPEAYNDLFGPVFGEIELD